MSKQVTLKELFTSENVSELLSGVPFETGLKLLEELVTKVETGSLPLDASIASYEKGVALIEQLRAQLSGAEEKLRLLQKDKSVVFSEPARS
jgi:exodeoxyribonuclease VII small subunit